MKILLIVPTQDYKGKFPSYVSISDFPAGLAYIAAALKKAGHEVTGLNLNNTHHKSALQMVTELTLEALKKKYGLIGIGGLCIDYACIKDCMKVIRDMTNTPIVLGGGIMRDGDFIFSDLNPDYAIKYEGEEAVVNLIQSMEGKRDIHTVNNLFYWKDGQPVYTRNNYDYCDIDDLPFADYDIFNGKEMIDKYSLFTRLTYRFPKYNPRPMIITAGRSCPFNCSFCVHSGGPKYRVRSIPNVMEEIRQNYEKYNFNILMIVDELFAATKTRAKEFCEAIEDGKKKYGWDFVWAFQTHANSKLDLETMKTLKAAGCYFFSYGIESANKEVLKSLNKKIKIEQIIEAIDLSEKAGLSFGGNILIGDTAETIKSVKEDVAFVSKHSQKSFVFIQIIQPYPGSALFDRAVKNGRLFDRKKYYETMGGVLYHLSENLSLEEFVNCTRFAENQMVEHGLTRGALGSIEEDFNIKSHVPGFKVWKITTVCPYCDKEINYSHISEIPIIAIWAVGCPHCGRKIKVEFIDNLVDLNLKGYIISDGTVNIRRNDALPS